MFTLKGNKIQKSSGGSQGAPPPAGDNLKDAVEQQPPPEINSIKIIAVEFLSDHKLLKDHDSSWDDGGNLYPKPEWTPSAQHPVSHSMGESVRIKVTLEIGPEGATPKKGKFVGKGPAGLTFEQADYLFQPGQPSVVLTCQGELPKKLQELAFEIAWSTEGVGASPSPAKTTNKMFVTRGRPAPPSRRPGVTLKRMRQAIKISSGASDHADPHSIIQYLMKNWSQFNLAVVYDNEWELSDNIGTGADCQSIVRYIQSVILMLGCPGTADFIVVWAKVPTPTKGEENPAYVPNVSNPKQWYSSFNKPDPTKATWRATLVDSKGGKNRYEACLRFGHGGMKKYYAGGVGMLTTANEVIKVFTTMSWVDETDGAIKGHIHKYR